MVLLTYYNYSSNIIGIFLPLLNMVHRPREISPEKATECATNLHFALCDSKEFTVQVDDKSVSVRKQPLPHIDDRDMGTPPLQIELTIEEFTEAWEERKQALRITDTPTTSSEYQRVADRGTGSKRNNGRLTMDTIMNENRTIFDFEDMPEGWKVHKNVLTVGQFNQIIALLERAHEEHDRIEQEKEEAVLKERQKLRSLVSSILSHKGGKAKPKKGSK